MDTATSANFRWLSASTVGRRHRSQWSSRHRSLGSARSRGHEQPRTVERPLTRRWTPPEAFKPHILAILQESGGELEADELFLELEILVEDRLLPGDRERTPEGELRWQYAARRARVALINEGLMAKGIPGMWKLGDTGSASAD